MHIPFSQSLMAILAGLLFVPTYAVAAPVVFSGSGSDAATVLGANNAMEG